MIKTYCDICGDELTAKNEPKGGRMVDSRLGVEIRRKGHRFKFEILASANGVANKGEICKYCVLDALYRLDDRPGFSGGSRRTNRDGTTATGNLVHITGTTTTTGLTMNSGEKTK